MFKRQMAGNRATQKKLDLKFTKNREQLTKLQLEIAKTLTGDSIYSPEELSHYVALKFWRKRVLAGVHIMSENEPIGERK